MSRIVSVFDRRTGKRCAVPEHWLGTRLGAAYARDNPNATPKASPQSRGSRSQTADTTTATTDWVVAPEAPADGDAREGE